MKSSGWLARSTRQHGVDRSALFRNLLTPSTPFLGTVGACLGSIGAHYLGLGVLGFGWSPVQGAPIYATKTNHPKLANSWPSFFDPPKPQPIITPAAESQPYTTKQPRLKGAGLFGVIFYGLFWFFCGAYYCTTIGSFGVRPMVAQQFESVS